MVKLKAASFHLIDKKIFPPIQKSKIFQSCTLMMCDINRDFLVQYCPEVRLHDSHVCVTRRTRRLARKICRIFITSQLDSKRFKMSKTHCTIIKFTHATRKTRVWFNIHPDPVYVTVHVKTYKHRKKKKIQLHSKRTNPAFTCIHVHILVCSPAFTGELTAFISNAIECSSVFKMNAAMCSKWMQQCVRNEHSVFEANTAECLKQCSILLKQTPNFILIKKC